ncbi:MULTISPECIES: acetolactate synthase small subunit [unclassified Candidatus Paralachnospira]|uniref:acetolactate synthase small subunit n=1 Tax=unclassified Candidatus Paralachnospira TaxID=3099471 RepID=UPI003F8EA08C
MSRAVFSLLVENTAGVLSRISGLFSRRGYNIDSLTVGETENPLYSRMTVVARGDDEILEQIRRQLEKLVDVIDITELKSHSTAVCRELLLIKIGVKPEEREKLMSVVNIFRAKVIDVAEDSMIVELTGNQAKVDAFIRLIGDFTVKEMARTGITGLPRGTVSPD